MRNALVTSFWQKAERSLPSPYRERYHGHFVRAERCELALDAIAEFFSRLRIKRLLSPSA